MAKIDAFFQLMHDQGASDLHLVSGQQPVLRIRGEMERVKFNVLNNDELKAILYEIISEETTETGTARRRKEAFSVQKNSQDTGKISDREEKSTEKPKNSKNFGGSSSAYI